MKNDELKFANDARNAVENAAVPGAWVFLLFLFVFFAAVVWWASWAKVEQVTNGIGEVIPSRQIQLVESLEPGIVREILVQAGDKIREGQNLVRIDDTDASSRLGELQQKHSAFSAEQYRLKIQAERSDEFEMPENVDASLESYYADQRAIFNTEKRRLEEKLAILKSQLVQRKQSYSEAAATVKKQSEALKLSERELELTKNLFAKKAVPELEYLRVQRLVGELRGDIEIMEASKIRIAAEVDEAKNMIKAETSTFVATALDRISRVNAELSIVSESLKSARDRVNRTVFTSPVSGVVSTMNVATIGEVVQAGFTLVEIVPLDDKLLIEARIRPEDIAFIRPGLRAIIRLSAYDYTKYGTLAGVVERIGADTTTDENQETFYQVIISTDESQPIPDEIRIIPGMLASVDISTGERTVLEYLLKPVLKIRDRAFRDPK